MKTPAYRYLVLQTVLVYEFCVCGMEMPQAVYSLLFVSLQKVWSALVHA